MYASIDPRIIGGFITIDDDVNWEKLRYNSETYIPIDIETFKEKDSYFDEMCKENLKIEEIINLLENNPDVSAVTVSVLFETLINLINDGITLKKSSIDGCVINLSDSDFEIYVIVYTDGL